METLEPFNIIYQTAEDGLGDTVKPRLMEAEADLERVLVIDDRDTPLTLAAVSYTHLDVYKRQERKDRLHQNYLKRKASGAQKRYEDKIKGRKKAEIEAKKAAIRAEDIAKGVFVPVSSLPQREPMKGVQTA